MKHTEIRDKFLKFFKSKGHRVVMSDSLVPAEDPTLLFTSAGMNQFKEEFLGNVKDYTRATSCQKCLRTPDLENVGRTAYHHTFFEMLGNFSFGDYFKEEAILWAWEFMKDLLNIPEEKLWVSVYEEDEEAYGIWKKQVGLPDEKIIGLGQKENFWPSEAKDKGPNGPCGPCSEIFFDYGPGIGCGKKNCTPACACGRFVEVWNLVFTQFDRKEGGGLDALPNKNIDTGMGLERLCALMQGAANNFETDLFIPIIRAVKSEAVSSCPGGDRSAPWPEGQCVKAIADHARAVSFAICDGVVPSNEERGYVIRSIIRKAAVHGRFLGIERPFLYKLVYAVGKVMEAPYPEVLRRHQDIAEVIRSEEDRFSYTLKNGLRLLREEIAKEKRAGAKLVRGETAFKLLDTHGVPFEVIRDIAGAEGMGVEKKRFKELMDAQREKSRKMSKMRADVFVDSGIREKTEFIGYDRCAATAKVTRILGFGNQEMELEEAGEETGRVKIILDKSVFYGGGGGQDYDTGEIRAEALRMRVFRAARAQDAILLYCDNIRGSIHKGDVVECFVDEERRFRLAKNHTATHLLQAALRKVIGEHVKQQGSFVGEEALRFDFSHFKPLTDEQLERVEGLVNQYIKAGCPVNVREMSIEEAKGSGALAFFGDKYGRKVRVVAVGDCSRELCGGTHLKNTSDAELFKITREGSVASGIRRIEARTSDAARAYVRESRRRAEQKEDMLRKKEEEKRLLRARLKKAEEGVGLIISKAREIGGVSLVTATLDRADVNILRRTSDLIKPKLNSFVLFLIGIAGARMNLLLSVSRDQAAKGLDAGRLMNTIAGLAGGSGGGKPEMALGGAKDTTKADYLMKEARAILIKEVQGGV